MSSTDYSICDNPDTGCPITIEIYPARDRNGAVRPGWFSIYSAEIYLGDSTQPIQYAAAGCAGVGIPPTARLVIETTIADALKYCGEEQP